MADKIIAQETEKLKNRRWQYTAKHLSELKPSTNYSAKACKKRFQALMSDTAKIPPELDDDPVKRAQEKADRELAWMEKQKDHETAVFEASERARRTEECEALARAQKRLQNALRKQAQEAKRTERIQKAAEKQAQQEAKLARTREQALKKIDQLNNTKSRRDSEAALLREQHENFDIHEYAAKMARDKNLRDEFVASKVAITQASKKDRKGTRKRARTRSVTPVLDTAWSPPSNRRRSIRDASTAASSKIHDSADPDDDGFEDSGEEYEDDAMQLE